MSEGALVLILTLGTGLAAVAVGLWLGLRLVRGNGLRQDRPRLNRMTAWLWIAAAVAVGAWIASDGRLRFMDACFAFVIASIAIFAIFRRPGRAR